MGVGEQALRTFYNAFFRLLTRKQCTDLINRVSMKYGIKPPTLERRWKAHIAGGYYCRCSHSIRLYPRARVRSFLYHELAHAVLARRDPTHYGQHDATFNAMEMDIQRYDLGTTFPSLRLIPPAD